MISPKKAQLILRYCSTAVTCVKCPAYQNCHKAMKDTADLIAHMDSIIKKFKEEKKNGKTADHQAQG
ncbi:MAG: hypothetical protein J6A48_07070 [Clostridia bacterium]|nr:hypothetical protein [Clostridia bacterium]